MSEEEVCDGFGNGKAGSAFEPEEFAARVKFEKDVFLVGGENDVDGAVVQGKVIHEAQDFFFNLERELVALPVLKYADCVAAPVVSCARGDL